MWYALTRFRAGDVRRRLGEIPPNLEIRKVDPAEMPSWMRSFIDPAFPEGVAWKFAPVRLAPESFELSLDNDVIFWRVPAGLSEWLARGKGCLMAEDVRACFGKFGRYCGREPRNSGIRGLSPGLPYKDCLRSMLSANPVLLNSELDEQGLQIATLLERRVVEVEGAAS